MNFQETVERLSRLDLTKFRVDGNPKAPVFVDMDRLNEDPIWPQVIAAAKIQDGALWTRECTLVKGRNRARDAAEDRMRRRLVTYASLPAHMKVRDDGRAAHYQYGLTPYRTETAIGIKQKLAHIPWDVPPVYWEQPNASARWSEPFVTRAYPGATRFPDLRPEPIAPEYFVRRNEGASWGHDLILWGSPFCKLADQLIVGVTRGLGLPDSTFAEAMTFRQDLIAPTWCELSEAKLGDNISSIHEDCSVVTFISQSFLGSPDAPRFFMPAGGLSAWNQQGTRIEFVRPAGDGWVFAQAGKGLRQLLAGAAFPEPHEATVTALLLMQIEEYKRKAAQMGFTVKRIFRINIPYFTTPNVDAYCAIANGSPLWRPNLPAEFAEFTYWGDFYRNEFNMTLGK